MKILFMTLFLCQSSFAEDDQIFKPKKHGETKYHRINYLEKHLGLTIKSQTINKNKNKMIIKRLKALEKQMVLILVPSADQVEIVNIDKSNINNEDVLDRLNDLEEKVKKFTLDIENINKSLKEIDLKISDKNKVAKP